MVPSTFTQLLAPYELLALPTTPVRWRKLRISTTVRAVYSRLRLFLSLQLDTALGRGSKQVRATILFAFSFLAFKARTARLALFTSLSFTLLAFLPLAEETVAAPIC
jgi:hypothetical protein